MIKEKRASQAALATDIHAMLQDTERGTLLAEGGTGIGKSFAYLIPSLIREDKRIVIATAKKTLQDQLFTKDVPYVCDSIGSKKRYVIYKGKSNYACWLLASEVHDALDKKHYLEFINDARVWEQPADIKDWKGGRPTWWPKVDISNCIMGKNCPHILQCKPQPQQSNIVITNHHLLAIDLKLGPGFLLGDYNMLIVDEGHQAPEAFRAAYTHRITSKGLDGLRAMVVNDENLRALIDDSGAVSSKIFVAQVKALIAQYNTYHKEIGPYTNAVGQVDIVQGRKQIFKLAGTAREMNRQLEGIYKATQNMLQHSSSSYSEDYNAVETFSRDQLRSLTRKIKRVVSRVGSIMEFISRLHDSEHVGRTGNYLLTRQPEGVKIEPIQVGPLVRKALRRAQHKVIVSATLAMGKDFSHTEESYGLTPVEPDD
ncbi:hypothetical protein, partial [Neptuniibacter sp.]|uniref:ATP-dependent DNA helicase n=1 Tax=Neptuniibacter sp. TaxID=1962643 RepID=UPI00260FB405